MQNEAREVKGNKSGKNHPSGYLNMHISNVYEIFPASFRKFELKL